MSRSNYDKPFYVDVGTSIVAIRCASNHDVLVRYDHVVLPHTIELIEKMCDRMNKEVEISRPLRNCDVGTADEQVRRHLEWCERNAYKCQATPSCAVCLAEWAQMPYEEGGAK